MKNLILRAWWLCVCGCYCWPGPAPLCCWAKEPPSKYYQRAVEVPAASEAELLSLTLDAPVYAAAADAWKKSRILDDHGQVVPYVVRQVTTSETQRVRTSCRTEKPTLRPLPDGGLEITVRLISTDPPPDRLRLVTPLDNFEQGVQVLASVDGATDHWETLVDDATIFDYSQYMDVRQDQIALPPMPHRRYRFFRIVVNQVTSAQESRLLELTRTLRGSTETARTEQLVIDRRPFRILGVEFSAEVEEARTTGSRIIDYPPQAVAIEQDLQQQQTHILITTGYEPLTQFMLQTDEKNFSRRATVEVADEHDGKTTWQKISRGTLSRIDFKTLQREELTLTFPQTQAAKFRLIIENRDAAPLPVTGVQAQGHVYQLVLLAEPGRRYRLLHGQPSAPAAQVDTATIETLIGNGFTPKPAKLGPPEQVADGLMVAPVHWTQWLNDPRLFIPMIVLLVGLLAWGLVRAAKRIDQMP